jgi:dethiobiotin synthetase
MFSGETCSRNMGIEVLGIIINGVKSRPGLDEKTNPSMIETLCNRPALYAVDNNAENLYPHVFRIFNG